MIETSFHVDELDHLQNKYNYYIQNVKADHNNCKAVLPAIRARIFYINTLEKNNLLTKMGEKYGATYFVSPLFEEAEPVFDEIVGKLKKTGGAEWSR